jgi:hypothetical protein
MRIHMDLIGTTPLIMHSDRLADPDDEFTRAIKEITDKKTNQTDSDKALRKKLEWFGGLYTDEKGDVVIPVRNIIKCLIDAAAITKSGRKISAGLSPTHLTVPLMNGGGSRHKDELWKNEIYHFNHPVGIGRRRVMRTRPIFPKWNLGEDFELLDDVLNFDALARIAELAGRAKGLGDARILGYGRFEAKITKVK